MFAVEWQHSSLTAALSSDEIHLIRGSADFARAKKVCQERARFKCS